MPEIPASERHRLPPRLAPVAANLSLPRDAVAARDIPRHARAQRKHPPWIGLGYGARLPMHAAPVRDRLIHALRLDLVGPDPLDPRDESLAREVL